MMHCPFGFVVSFALFLCLCSSTNNNWGVIALSINKVPSSSSSSSLKEANPSTTTSTIIATAAADQPSLLLVQQDHSSVDFECSPSSTSLSLWKLALAGCVASIVGDATVHPIDCIKTLQQSEEGYGMNVLQAIQYLWTSFGIFGFYHGLGTYVVSDAIGGAIKFTTYESMKKKWTATTTTFQQPKQQQQLLQNQQEQQQQDQPPPESPLILFACAAMAFFTSSIVLVPGEFLKQQLQMSHYDTLGEAILGVSSISGLTGFFAGYDGVCLRDVPYTMLELGLYDVFKKQTKLWRQGEESNNDTNNSNNQWWLSLSPAQEEIILAAITGGIVGFVTTPLDTIKTKVMVNSDLYTNFWDCLVSTVHQHGLLSIFAGCGARVAWLIPFTAIYLPVYDLLKRKLTPTSKAEDEVVTNNKIVQ